MTDKMFSLGDTLCDMHEIASAIAVEFPVYCGRLHVAADLIEHQLRDRLDAESKKGVKALARDVDAAVKAMKNGNGKHPKARKQHAASLHIHKGNTKATGTGLVSKTAQICPYCEDTFKSPAGLGRHMKACAVQHGARRVEPSSTPELSSLESNALAV